MYVMYIIVASLLGLFGVFTYHHFLSSTAYRAYVGSSTDRHLKAVEGPEPETRTTPPPPHVW